MTDDGHPRDRPQVLAELASTAAHGTCCTPSEQGVFGTSRYGTGDLDALPATAAAASLGCGNPTAVADLAAGDVVLDLGSGGGIDVILSARRVGPTGTATVLSEAARVLRPGGRFAVSDVIADGDMVQATRRDVDQWVGCIAGALTCDEYTDLLTRAGFTGIEMLESHRVHEHAASAIIRATKPTAP